MLVGRTRKMGHPHVVWLVSIKDQDCYADHCPVPALGKGLARIFSLIPVTS